MSPLALLCLCVAIAAGQALSCNLRGCQSGTGYAANTWTDYTLCKDIPNHTACSYWDVCYNEANNWQCNAVLYGGVNGYGAYAGQNEYAPNGTQFQWVETYNVAFTPGNVVSAYIGLMATIDSGYTYPNAVPYQLQVSVANNLPPFVVQLVGVNRNPKWLNPNPGLPNWGFTPFIITLPDTMLAALTSPQQVTFSLLTPGWMAVNHTWMTVNTCDLGSCICNSGPMNGYWTGPGCTQCQVGYAGAYCDAEVNPAPPAPVTVVDDSHLPGLRAGVAIMTLTTVGFILTSVWFYMKYRKATGGSSGERTSFVSNSKL